MQTTSRRHPKIRKRPNTVYRLSKPRAKGGHNGHIDVVSPATGAEMRKTLGIKRSQVRSVIQTLQSVGIHI
jgi:hypothetical protein